MFIPYGEVVKVNVKRDKITGHNLGYGFIQFKVAPRALPSARRIWPAAAATLAVRRTVRVPSSRRRSLKALVRCCLRCVYLIGAGSLGQRSADAASGSVGPRRTPHYSCVSRSPGWLPRSDGAPQIAELDPKITTEDLRREFSRFGPVVEDETFVRRSKGPSRFVRADRPGRVVLMCPAPMQGFVRFQARVDAERAKAALNAQMFGGRLGFWRAARGSQLAAGRRQIRVGWGDHNIQKHCVYVTPQVSLPCLPARACGRGELSRHVRRAPAS